MYVILFEAMFLQCHVLSIYVDMYFRDYTLKLYMWSGWNYISYCLLRNKVRKLLTNNFYFFQRNLTEYYNAVDSNNMMIIFASMLYERRIIFTSRRLNRLSACVQSANAIIYPMHWQHIFIPVLPQQLVDYLLAPMPYLIGVSSTLLSVSMVQSTSVFGFISY